MKKIGFVIFAAALILGVVLSNAFSFGRVDYDLFSFKINFGGAKGSGNVVTEKRSVPEFSKIDVSSVLQVDFTAGQDFSVEVEADDNLLPLIKTESNGDTLRIFLDKKVSRHSAIRIRVSAPKIEAIEASGVSRVAAAGITGSSLDIDTSGASKVTVRGQVNDLKVRVSGASKIDAEDLKATNADVDASGASKAIVNVSGQLRSEASGASHITYTGNPASVERHSSGASKISQR